MSSGLYKTHDDSLDTTFNLKELRAYGDTMNDSRVQLSFTLPVPDDERGMAAARALVKKMGFPDPEIAYHSPLDSGFTFYVVYGFCSHSVNYEEIQAPPTAEKAMTIDETDEFIRSRFGRKIVVVGASTGTDAHTVGIDAIMNRKGFAGHYGLERYSMLETYNLGSQVENEDFLKKARELSADVLLVSQTVTQRDIHIKNLENLVELMEAEGVRDRFVLICGGARITATLAKELGYDAGFGAGKYADDVATFFVNELYRRGFK